MGDLRKYMNIVEGVLTEMDWHDTSPMIPILQKHRGKFVHFSQINKIGINPKKSHRDPHGIYFYPVDWLLGSDSRRLKDGDQFGVNWPFYFVCDIDMSGPGAVLSKVTWNDLQALADRNGWGHVLTAFRNGEETVEIGNHSWRFNMPHYLKPDMPGSVMWHLVDWMQKNETISWAKAFAGLTYIYDDGNGIVMDLEPAQVIALDPRIVRVIESGNNKAPARGDGWGAWNHAIKTMFATLAEKYNGKVEWKDQKPEVVFSVEDKHFRLEFTEKYSLSLYLHFTYGRAKGYRVINNKSLRDESVPALLAQIDKLVSEIASMDYDVTFQPLLNEDIAHLFGEGKVFDDLDVDWENEVDNDRKQMWMVGRHDANPDGLKLQTNLLQIVREDSIRLKVWFHLENTTSLFGGAESPDSTYPPDAVESLFESFKKTVFESRLEQIYVRDENYNYYRPKFFPEQWLPFVGWLTKNSGLSFEGRLERDPQFTAAIEAYENFEHKEDLLYYIKQVFEHR